jgi:hypothetical protein
MTAYNGTQCAIIASGGYPSVTEVGGRVRAFNETVVYAAQASGSTFVVARLPQGAQILGFELVTDTSTGSATLVFGDGTTAAAYSTAAAFTTVNATQLVGPKLAGAGVLSPLTADGQIVITTAAASLPASGNLMITTYYTLD